MQYQINQTKLQSSQVLQFMLHSSIRNSELELLQEDNKFINTQYWILFLNKNSTPILTDEITSTFPIENFLKEQERNLFFDLSPKNQFWEVLENLVPSRSLNIKAKSNYEYFEKLLHMRCIHSKFLVIGASILGKNLENIKAFALSYYYLVLSVTTSIFLRSQLDFLSKLQHTYSKISITL
ncbi:hypothetical protein [Chlorogloeopsis sp. ULAP02]|uniref:hypothetical protein n=1 Tax=Chlorogloeopsis sp. ULAP02 TaxID=3107926 RepID=UPI0031353694